MHRSPGPKAAQLVVTLADGTEVRADLDGTGFTAATSIEEGTYYTCSTSSTSGGLLPCGLALLVARRCRRAI